MLFFSLITLGVVDVSPPPEHLRHTVQSYQELGYWCCGEACTRSVVRSGHQGAAARGRRYQRCIFDGRGRKEGHVTSTSLSRGLAFFHSTSSNTFIIIILTPMQSTQHLK